MSENKKEMSEEDYLKRHLNDLETGKKLSETKSEDLPFVQVESTTTSDLQFFNMDVRELPCGQFYPTGSLFMVRAAQVKEIQSYLRYCISVGADSPCYASLFSLIVF